MVFSLWVKGLPFSEQPGNPINKYSQKTAYSYSIAQAPKPPHSSLATLKRFFFGKRERKITRQ
jgi:hypothetical protein